MGLIKKEFILDFIFYIMQNYLLLFLIDKLIQIKIIKSFTMEELSQILIQLNNKGLNIIPIIEGVNGLFTPQLKYNIDDLIMYSILEGSPMKLTMEGKAYIDKKIALLKINLEQRKVIQSVLSSFYKYKHSEKN